MAKRTNKQKDLENALRESTGDGIDRFEYFVKNNQKQIFWGAGILVLLLAVIATLAAVQSALLRREASALSAARSETDLEAVLQKYGKGPSTFEARLRLARLYANGEKYEPAMKALEPLIQSPEPETSGRAKLMQAYFLENSNKFQEAFVQYAAVANNAVLPLPLQAEAAYGAGRLALKLGKNEEARTYLNRTASTGKNSEWARKAVYLLRQIPAAK